MYNTITTKYFTHYDATHYHIKITCVSDIRILSSSSSSLCMCAPDRRRTDHTASKL